MSYIDKTLMEGEEVIARAHLHWVIFVPTFFIDIIAFAFFVWAAIVKERDLTIVLATVGGVMLLISTILVLKAFIAHKTSEFAVTNRRVLIKTGVIRRKSLEILLSKVEGIQVDQSILGRILNYGSIVVTGTGGTREPYHKIASPIDFRKAVQEEGRN